MEQEKLVEEQSEQDREVYVPRPKWQIICAWIGVAIVAIGFLLYCWQIANAGGI